MCLFEVDVDGSGLVEWSEFAFSLMGAKAQEYGALADLEKLSTLMDRTAGLFSQFQSSLKEMQGSTEERVTS